MLLASTILIMLKIVNTNFAAYCLAVKILLSCSLENDYISTMKVNDAGQFWLRYKKLVSKDLSVTLKTGIKQSTLSTWKTKKLFPRADLACLIARSLGTSVEYLVTGKDGKLTDEFHSSHELISNINRLNDENLKSLKSLVSLIEQIRKSPDD